jgi:hypothetical protein
LHRGSSPPEPAADYRCAACDDPVDAAGAVDDPPVEATLPVIHNAASLEFPI